MAGDEPKIGPVLDLDDDMILSRVRTLVSRGLERYGAGDLEGAMSEWEHALVLDEDNAQAREYIDYVRNNIDVLDATFRSADRPGASADLELPFGIEEVPGGEGALADYESLEIVGGEPAVDESGMELAGLDASPDPAPASGTAVGSGPTPGVGSDALADDGPGVRSDVAAGVRPDSAGAALDSALDAGWSLDNIPVPGSQPQDSVELGEALEEIDAGLKASLEEIDSVATESEALDSARPSPAPAGPEEDEEPLEIELSAEPPPEEEEVVVQIDAELPEESAAGLDRDTADLALQERDTVELTRQDRERLRAASVPPADPEGAGAQNRELVDLSSYDESSGDFGMEEATSEYTRPDQGDDEPTRRWPDLGAVRAAVGRGGLEALTERLRADLEARGFGSDAVAGAVDRVGLLLARAEQEHRAGDPAMAVAALDLADAEAAGSADAQELLSERESLFNEIYRRFVGAPGAILALAVPLHELEMHALDHRAAFLLSRIDGPLSVEDLLDVCGMSNLEAYRHLSRLVLRGILELR